jgi:DNA ligase-1
MGRLIDRLVAFHHESTEGGPMPLLKDGESVEVQGSASRPYVLKNIGGVLSCSCPAWRFQSLPIESRSCRHLRIYQGNGADQPLVGATLPLRAKSIGVAKAPPLLLAEKWESDLNPAGYLMSEKLDGVRAFWDGQQFRSRNGNRFFAPLWFTAGLPLEPLDGELWIGRKQFQRTVGIVRRQDEPDLWKEVRYVVFDAPAEEGPFEARLRVIEAVMEINRPAYAVAHPHVACSGRDHLHDELACVESLGGEGLMLREPRSLYMSGRSNTLLKVKSFRDAEARVIGYEPGSGRHKGRMGALVVQMANGVQFEIGTGFTDAQRTLPPPVGSTVTFKYTETTDSGTPRFASFRGVRGDLPVAAHHTLFEPGELMAVIATKRRFVFIGGGSDKFWEVAVHGPEVVVRYGRNGTNGQNETKTFGDADAAAKHAEKKIAEKVRKGYVEVK